MNSFAIPTKLLSLFILAFLCLNAGGAICLAYCEETSTIPNSSLEHCPLPKKSDDCHRATGQIPSKSDVASLETDEVICCTLAINVFIAPLERRHVQPEIAAEILQPSGTTTQEFLRANSYGPYLSFVVEPQLDRRVERIKNRVIRI
jgi:hypothetical protein